jgi:3-phytase
VATIAERYVTAADPAMNIDSVATWSGSDGITWLFATAKQGDVVRIYDAANGAHVRDLGGAGTDAGRFERPNGVIALNDLLIIVERDNRRVQVFTLPALEPIGLFGQDELVKPYGAYVRALGADRYELFVTDAYETAAEQVPPEAELDRRIQVFSMSIERGAGGAVEAVTAAHTRAFGATSGPGVLRVVESIWGDPANDRLMIAEEDPAGGRVLKVYSFDGRFSGEIVGDGLFRVQPEGIALYECGDDGYWISTDQDLGTNVFHLFDRRTLAHVGAFQGATTQNTDGIWLARKPLPGFPAGALFAVHDDQAVAAFDWRDIAAALDLAQGCVGT